MPTATMLRDSNASTIAANEIVMLTNSLAATPNVTAYSGFMHHREKDASSNVDLYEFQGLTEFLHTKINMINRRISVRGSFNLDARSSYLSTESVVIIHVEYNSNQFMVSSYMYDILLLLREIYKG
ncbi:phospholipase D-like domain-containing protein [Halalkalibacter kiskunsagensis]|uniref:Phospholipase D-like domain-containing protein n=1 Tax=Halalkalibacter kiskunsagensis TaxID=1548599 RepID=A0ABV6KC60_9BACI